MQGRPLCDPLNTLNLRIDTPVAPSAGLGTGVGGSEQRPAWLFNIGALVVEACLIHKLPTLFVADTVYDLQEACSSEMFSPLLVLGLLRLHSCIVLVSAVVDGNLTPASLIFLL